MNALLAEPGILQVEYGNEADMDPAQQTALITLLENEVARGPVGVLFLVQSASVPRAVPEFWFGVTTRLAPKLCAMAIVSGSVAVRAAASGFGVTNSLRGVQVAVKAFRAGQQADALSWLRSHRPSP